MLEDCKLMSTPMHPTCNLSKDDTSSKEDPKMYKGMIGSLFYLTTYIHDILFSVCLRARYQSDHRESHLTASLGLLYKKFQDYKLVECCDPDYDGDIIERKSTNVNCQIIGENLISWSSKRQSTIAFSTT